MTPSRAARLLPMAVLAGLWLAAHGLSLTRFPAMHADEAWLASETRSILVARSAAATADFFRLTPRSPHAIRLLFHGLQAPFVAASWSLASVRLLSLACGLGVIALFAALAGDLFRSPAARLLLVGGLALDPQLFVSSHLARPEIVLVLALGAALLLRRRRPLPGLGTEALVGTVLGLAAGIHANGLLVALGVGALYAADLLAGPDRRRALGRLAVLFGVALLWAALWVGWSRLLSPDFPRAYGEFGRGYGVGDSLPVKLLRLPAFYRRLFQRIAGTYYVPDVRLPLLLFAASAVSAAALFAASAVSAAARVAARGLPRPLARRLRPAEPLAMLAGINLGLVAIGKYSQPSAVLLIPGGYWLAASLLEALVGGAAERLRGGGAAARAAPGSRPASGCPRLRAGAALAAALLLLGGLGVSTARQALPRMRVSYGRYLARIRAHVPAEAPTLAGLNTAFAFAPGRLHAFNDLEALEAGGLSFERYIEAYGIRFILYPSELDLIYRQRPIWNDLYGNLAPYYRDMKRFLAERCAVVAGYDEPVFALRPLLWQGRSPGRLTIYRVLPRAP